MKARVILDARAERALLLVLILAAAALRFWALGGKGLWYDEAITAAMTQLTIPEIAQFHWQSAFTHLPGWYILLNVWAKVFGISEFALRLPSAFAGVLAVPLIWQVIRVACPADRALRLLGASLLAFSPLMVLYSQEARMYAIATCLALASVYLIMRLASRSQPALLVALVLVNWAMLVFQYYFVLLVGIEGLFLLVLAASRRFVPVKELGALAISCLPLALRALGPGFQMTAENLVATANPAQVDWLALVDKSWRDLAFGIVIWQPRQSVLGYVLAAPFVVGVVAALRHRSTAPAKEPTIRPIPWLRLFLLIVALPGVITALLLGDFYTRYILYVAPFFLIIVALGIVTLGRLLRPLGAVAFLAVSAVAVIGLVYYFGAYQRSAYRDMAQYLGTHASDDAIVLLEAPRQHLLADYYLPSHLKVLPVPDVPLPAHLPITAPPIVPAEVDRQLQPLLDANPDLWLILAGEDEVDRGEFALSYLDAAAYRLDCRDWLDVKLCHFLTPEGALEGVTRPLNVAFQGEMRLHGASVVPYKESDERALLVTLDWKTQGKPTKDYKITLRLLSPDGKVVSQTDDFPIGSLLPPTTWGENSEETGRMVLPLPSDLPAGGYRLSLALYDPASLETVPVVGRSKAASDLVWLALVRVGDTIRVRPAPPGFTG